MTAESITVIAPGRVNLLGSHTDYNGGLVLPMAIDRVTTIEGRRSGRITLVSDYDPARLDIAIGDVGSAAERLPDDWGRYVVATAQELDRDGGIANGIEGTVSTTIPVGSGLSSSAALEVGTALALGYGGDPRSLAELARRAEHVATGVPTGIMDQLCIAAAQADHAMLIDCSTLEIEQVPFPDDLAVWVRFVAHRTLQGSEYADRVRECEAAAAVIGPPNEARLEQIDAIEDDVARRRARHIISDNQRVRELKTALVAGDYATAGALVTECHRSLANDFEISTPVMDAAVDEYLDTPGVYGARLTGGGFGGCVIVLADPSVELDGWRVRPAQGAHRR